MKRGLVDTDILIDVARNIDAAVQCLERLEHDYHEIAISVITQMELLVGCRNTTEFRHTDQFLQRFHLLPLHAQIGTTATHLLYRYRLSHGLLIPDALIAATAITNQCPLISKNQRDYRFISELDLLAYPMV